MIKKTLLSLSLFTAISIPSLAQAAPADDLTSYLSQTIEFHSGYRYTTNDGQKSRVVLDVLRPNNFIWSYPDLKPKTYTITNGKTLWIEQYIANNNTVTKMDFSSYPYLEEPYVLITRNSLTDWSQYTITEQAFIDNSSGLSTLRFTLIPINMQGRKISAITIDFNNTTPFKDNYIEGFTTYYSNGSNIQYIRNLKEVRGAGSNGDSRFNIADSHYNNWTKIGF